MAHIFNQRYLDCVRIYDPFQSLSIRFFRRNLHLENSFGRMAYRESRSLAVHKTAEEILPRTRISLPVLCNFVSAHQPTR